LIRARSFTIPGLHALTIAAHLSIAICGSEPVPAVLLDRAESIAANVYRDIGVAIEWSDCRDQEGGLEVDLTTRDALDAPVADATLGFAEPGGSVATVLYDRVGKFAKRFGVKREVLLGYAIAHEIGHLLLPPNSHSPSGVMRASLDLDQAAAKKLRFTREQGELILDRLDGVAPLVVATR
jgi:hypothetical protein